MKTNKFTKWLILSLSIVALSGCDITLYPEDKITPGSYFKSEEELELFTNTFYTYFPTTAIYEDEADIIINPQLDDAVSGQRIIPETKGGNLDGWGWTLLRQVNYYLENSHRCEDKEARAHYDGIARFFRAYFYYHKVRMYGNVPWYDQVIGSADNHLLNKPQDNRKYVTEKMVEDLNFAIENIRTTDAPYRITKWAAMALKSRVLLFEGTFRKYHGIDGWEECLEGCVEVSEEFMAKSGYSLYTSGSTPYQSMFNSSNAASFKQEIILARDFNGDVKLTHNAQTYVVSPTAGCAGVTRRLADAYLMKDGSRFTDKPNYSKLSFVEECQNRDPRMAQTLRTPGFKSAPDLAAAKLGYQLIKYYMSNKSEEGASDVDLPLFRSAEVYLNLAEAKAELGTLTQADLDKTINKLRARVGVSGLSMASANANPDPWLLSKEYGYPNLAANHGAYSNTTNLGVILEIRRERTVELVMEGLRYWDIMRWREGKVFEQPFVGLYIPGPGLLDLNNDGTDDYNIQTASNEGDKDKATNLKIGTNIYLHGDGESGFLTIHSGLAREWREDRDYFYPIPTQDRILTNGALKQNPGWDDKLPF